MDPLSIASATAGILSFGLTVCHGLLEYYSAWKSIDGDVKRMYDTMELLTKTFHTLKQALESPLLGKDAVRRVDESIVSCKDGVLALKKKLSKIRTKASMQRSGWKNTTWAQLQRTLYPFRESTLAKLREVCHELRENLALAVDALHIDTSVISLEKINILDEKFSDLSGDIKSLERQSSKHGELLYTLTSIHQDEYLMKIYDWLSPLAGEFQRKQLDLFNVEARQDRLGHWLLNTSHFRAWMEDNGKIFLCTGKQGTGKSVLASFIVGSLQRKFQQKNVGIAYLYCHYTETQKQTTKNLMGNILQQLLLQNCISRDKLTSVYEQHAKNQTHLTAVELSELLQIFVRGFSRVFIIIDALDECSEVNSVREALVTENRKLLPYISLFVTSRHIPIIQSSLSDATSLEIEPDDLDIRNYLQQRLDNWESLQSYIEKDANLKDMIIDKLVIKVGKMFLLARLYIDSLMKLITLRKIKSALETLPESLDKMYDDMLARIQTQDPERATLAMKTLSWIFYAVRPLTIQELQHALAIEPGDAFLDKDGVSDKDTIVSICTGLISVQEGNIVGFIHYTIREYLARRARIFFNDAQTQIARTCLTCISFDEFDGGSCADDGTFEQRLIVHPFLEYAASYWGDHARGPPERDVKCLALAFLSSSPKISCSLQVKDFYRFRHDRYQNFSQDFVDGISGLALAAMFGLFTIVNAMIKDGVDIEARDAVDATALHRAVVAKSVNGSRLLIEKGADVRACTAVGLTPLHFAAIEGQHVIARLLLDMEADVNAKTKDGMTALHYAASNGHAAVLRLLISHGADIESTDSHDGTALYKAAEGGWEDTLQLLTFNKANIEAQNDLHQSPLIAAAQNGHLGVACLLLKNGADQMVRDFMNLTALDRAAENGHLTVVRFLLENGNGCNSKNSVNSALSLALLMRHGQTAELLKDWESKVETLDDI